MICFFGTVLPDIKSFAYCDFGFNWLSVWANYPILWKKTIICLARENFWLLWKSSTKIFTQPASWSVDSIICDVCLFVSPPPPLEYWSSVDWTLLENDRIPKLVQLREDIRRRNKCLSLQHCPKGWGGGRGQPESKNLEVVCFPFFGPPFEHNMSGHSCPRIHGVFRKQIL